MVSSVSGEAIYVINGLIRIIHTTSFIVPLLRCYSDWAVLLKLPGPKAASIIFVARPPTRNEPVHLSFLPCIILPVIACTLM